MNKGIVVITLIILSMSAALSASDYKFTDGLKAYLKGDISQGVSIWQELAQEGDVKSQKQLGQYYLTDHEHRNYEEALRWYREAAIQGDENAIKHLKSVLMLYDTWNGLYDEIGNDAALTTMTLREHLHEGMDTHCGFVVEVKNKVVLLQTPVQPRWFKKNEIYPVDLKECSFLSREVALR